MTNYFYNMEKYNYHSILYMYIYISVCAYVNILSDGKQSMNIK